MSNYDVTLGYTEDNIQSVLDGEKWFTVRDPAEYDKEGVEESARLGKRIGLHVNGEIVGSVLPVAVIPLQIYQVYEAYWLGKQSPYTDVIELCDVLNEHYGKEYDSDSYVDLIFHMYSEGMEE